MDFSLNIVEELDFLHLQSVGVITTVQEYKQVQEHYFAAIMNSSFKKVLLDVRQFEFPKEILDQIAIVKYYQEEEVFPGIRQLKVATIFREGYEDSADFWETYAFNRGFNFKVFPDVDSAKAWLLS